MDGQGALTIYLIILQILQVTALQLNPQPSDHGVQPTVDLPQVLSRQSQELHAHDNMSRKKQTSLVRNLQGLF